ncbi:CoA pyrophosphatase [Sporolactobacillus sp. THM19-2]|jgi:8-oxo-dGTP pyrophosphatase MutT (NUDIX family)|uniref:NUDIX hydrolase n=1 Tax=Sporolactobacillus sp. THM19-2 TaxID=2511171 RepID=UPI00101FE830|nr:CoA pyrophosphatase [Sporolactobacillus sp. THM19-2]RYL88919.1 CoA pyrophosphatase [Sporolactobacillus sp. THM19-2]
MDLKSIQRRIENDGMIIGEDTAKKTSVFIPLIPDQDTWDLLLEVRSMNLKRQPGDVCFPGGRSEKIDSSLRGTAIRETSEELGVPEEAITVIGRMATCIATPDLFIYPFVGVIDADVPIRPNPDEVAEVFTIPLPWLMKQMPEKFPLSLSADPDQDFPFERIVSGKNYPFRSRKIIEPFYDYQGRTIWGLTARILEHFVSLINHRMFE